MARNRGYQVLLIASLLPLCWLLMQATHECGHAAGALATGGTVSRIVLYPLTISRTDLAENPHALIVVWAGPIVGVLLPLITHAVCKLVGLRWGYLVQFFAGFCLIANGAYIGVGSLEGIGDCGEMLALGTPIWCLWLFGLVTLPVGLYLWHGLGRRFGIGRDTEEPDRGAAYVVCGLLVITLTLELFFSPR